MSATNLELTLNEVLRQPAFKTSADAAKAGMRAGAGAGAIRTILHNIFAANRYQRRPLAVPANPRQAPIPAEIVRLPVYRLNSAELFKGEYDSRDVNAAL
ncbi:hypothetical protein [Sphingobium sp.]|uniref:hypothetical protein n=1 Tax=Sphingobium sp. TaxID=1912891 RepID=UPI0025795700|nr:hypothetical protein [Sphingobium sp.]